MFHLSRQRTLLRSSCNSLRKRATVGQRSTPTTIVTALTSLLSSSPIHTSAPLQNDNAAAAGAEEVVPIIWTTHRLTKEQIAKVDAIFHKVLWLDLFETSMLNELINQRLGLTMTPKQRKALQRYMDEQSGGGEAGGAKKQEEAVEEDAGPKLVDLKLAAYDAKAKIKVIKEVRAIAGLGLKEAKELVESAPKIIQKELKPEDAEELKKKLEEIGATIELV